MSASIIAPSQVKLHLDDPNWMIFDCRFSLADPSQGEQAYLNGHLPGAIYAHLDRDLSQPVISGVTGRHPLPEKADWEDTLQRWGIEKNRQVVVYDDQIGGIAARLWWMLRWSGLKQVAVMDGGWHGWLTAGYPVDNALPAPKTSHFKPDYQDEWIVSSDTVNRWSQDAQFLVVDSREAIRYRGEQEPIDPVAGHVPGAINMPFGENMNDDKSWKSVEQLKARFQAAVKSIPAEHTVFYCGSGVTACHNIMAYHQAGLGMPRLYAGSWSHWITDPVRPVATGDAP